MRLKKLSAFMDENLEADANGRRKPDADTVKQWPGARKIKGEWYMDMDVLEGTLEVDSSMEALLEDSDVAEAVG